MLLLIPASWSFRDTWLSRTTDIQQRARPLHPTSKSSHLSVGGNTKEAEGLVKKQGINWCYQIGSGSTYPLGCGSLAQSPAACEYHLQQSSNWVSTKFPSEVQRPPPPHDDFFVCLDWVLLWTGGMTTGWLPGNIWMQCQLAPKKMRSGFATA